MNRRHAGRSRPRVSRSCAICSSLVSRPWVRDCTGFEGIRLTITNPITSRPAKLTTAPPSLRPRYRQNSTRSCCDDSASGSSGVCSCSSIGVSLMEHLLPLVGGLPASQREPAARDGEHDDGATCDVPARVRGGVSRRFRGCRREVVPEHLLRRVVLIVVG